MATSKLLTGTPLSIDEFLDLPETWDRRKMELDEGGLYIMPSPRPVHGFLQLRIVHNVVLYLDAFTDPPAQVFQEVTVALPAARGRLLSPDIVIILQDRASIVQDRTIAGAPDIAVEVLSSDRARDLVRKRQLYAGAGVLEYWIADPRNDTVTLLALRDGEYVERAVLTAGDTLTTPLLPGLAIPLADVFRHRNRPA